MKNRISYYINVYNKDRILRKILKIVKKYCKKHCDKEAIIEAYERLADPPAYYLEYLYETDKKEVLNIFLNEYKEFILKNNNQSTKKQKYGNRKNKSINY